MQWTVSLKHDGTDGTPNHRELILCNDEHYMSWHFEFKVWTKYIWYAHVLVLIISGNFGNFTFWLITRLSLITCRSRRYADNFKAVMRLVCLALLPVWNCPICPVTF